MHIMHKDAFEQYGVNHTILFTVKTPSEHGCYYLFGSR